ncbi:hypothetical protein ACH41E_20500 [Streptomyces sp. NPDC020412]|uniref:hypothetical protein n=1 Tax=Streptomyces sp. NPDC020412 TaxID=3365073 RepID=UPI0037B668D7
MSPTTDHAPAPDRRRLRALAAGAAVALAVLLCGYAGWSYAATRGDDSRAYAEARDRVLADATRHLARLSSFDADDPGATQRGWLDASTGPLRAQLTKSPATARGAKGSGGKPATAATARATVTDAALTALDTRAGTAELIATVTVTNTPTASPSEKSTATTERQRLQAALARTDAGWKVESLTAVPVGGA